MWRSAGVILDFSSIGFREELFGIRLNLIVLGNAKSQNGGGIKEKRLDSTLRTPPAYVP